MYIYYIVLDNHRYWDLSTVEKMKCSKIESGCCCSGYMYSLGYGEKIKKGKMFKFCKYLNRKLEYEIQCKLINKYIKL